MTHIRRRFPRKALIGYLILFVFAALGVFRVEQIAQDANDLAKELVVSSREGCEQTNIVRDNQYGGLSDQIRTTEQSLRGNLGPALEPFRESIKAQNKQRRMRRDRLLTRIRAEHRADKPWLIDCKKAHP